MIAPVCGVEATWRAKDGGTWSGWLPHVDLGVARVLTVGSAPHDEVWDLLKKPGTLILRTRLNLWDMLRPAVQPGSKIDYKWPAEVVTVVFRSAADFTVKSPGKVSPATTAEDGNRLIRVTIRPAADGPTPFEMIVPTGSAARPTPLSPRYSGLLGEV